MKFTIAEYEKLNAGYCQIIPVESLFYPFENSLIDTVLSDICSVFKNSYSQILNQIPKLRSYKKQIKNIELHNPEEHLKDFFIENLTTGYFIEFCITIQRPFSLDEDSTWDTEWHYFPEFNLNEIEKELSVWAESKQTEWAKRDTRAQFLLLHAPSLLFVSDYAFIDTTLIPYLKEMPEQSLLVRQLPEFSQFKIKFPEKITEYSTYQEELKFIQNLIRTKELSGYFVELQAQVIVGNKKGEKLFTEWIYVTSVEEAQAMFKNWVLEKDNEQKEFDKSRLDTAEDE